MSASEIAAWVQAVGSILAILIAIWVPAYQHSKQRKAEEQKLQAYMRIFVKRVEFDYGLLRENKDKPDLGEKITTSIVNDLNEFIKSGVDQARGEACLELMWAFEGMNWEFQHNRPEMDGYEEVLVIIEEQFEALKKVAG